ncbi:hypothetical protein BGZ76_009145 [Entomortierella beljakovae]|nr:hypothetical protein BGZ76_009145 [Entomortierella beljakovae]
MVWNPFSPLNRNPSERNAIEQANEHLENARNANNPKVVARHCALALAGIKRAEKSFQAKNTNDSDLRNSISVAYREIGELLNVLAQESFQSAERWGQASVIPEKTDPSLLAAPLLVIPKDQEFLDTIQTTVILSDTKVPIPELSSNVVKTPLFQQDPILPMTKYRLPEIGERITSTPQLAYCISLLNTSLELGDGLNEAEYKWTKYIMAESGELERLKSITDGLVRTFIQDQLKQPDAVAEIVCLAAILDSNDFRKVLDIFINGINRSLLLEENLLDGLSYLLRYAAPGSLYSDDLVKILELLNSRQLNIHQQSTRHIRLMAAAVSRVLDSMVDCQVKGLKREQLHEPLSGYLKSLQECPDPQLHYQAAYAYQSLLYVPDDESILQATLRRTGKIIQGISGVVCAVKALDICGLLDGLQKIQVGISGAYKINDTFIKMKAVVDSGQEFIESLRSGLSFSQKSAWYPALRGLDALILEGRFTEFEELARAAPCRRDPAFQWGLCQRLEEIASSELWDISTRQCAVSFLYDIYSNVNVWGAQAAVKQQIYRLVTQLVILPDSVIAGYAMEYLLILENDSTIDLQANQNSPGPKGYSPEIVLPPRTSPLLRVIQNVPEVEPILSQIRRSRLKSWGGDIYVSPIAKGDAGEVDGRDLTSVAQEFLKSDKKVFLVLGSSGSGKSTFNRALENSLWSEYKKGGRIPLFIHLAAIDRPDLDLIPKYLQSLDFTKEQIRELKLNRQLVLICDGYDEIQEYRNLYSSNKLNHANEWNVQMVITCRSEFGGINYKNYFHPTDQSGRIITNHFQESIIESFNSTQIQSYIEQYVSSCKPQWEIQDYLNILNKNPSLKELVKNPFILRVAVEILPEFSDSGTSQPVTPITRTDLYDKFVIHWIERHKKRLTIDLGEKDRESLNFLSVGFVQQSIGFLKRVSAAVYDNQKGNPVIRYSRHSDRGTWKDELFNRQHENHLHEAIPLLCSEDQYKFIHKSVLEYGLALSVFSIEDDEEEEEPEHNPASHRFSVLSFTATTLEKKSDIPIEQSLLDSPLGRINLIDEPHILQFLAERAQQQQKFKQQLHAVLQRSKLDKSIYIAAANAITVLVKAGEQFIGADLSGIKVPRADLTFGMFDSVRLVGADLRKTKLRNAWLRNADLSGALMNGVQFGELPFVQEEDSVRFSALSPDGELYAASLFNGEISIYETSTWQKVLKLTGHYSETKSFAFSQKCDRLISGSSDDCIRVWDLTTGECIHIMDDHNHIVYSVAYSPNQVQFASAGHDKKIRIWDVETGSCLHVLDGHSSEVMSIMYSPSGEQIVSSSRDKTARVWNVKTGDIRFILEGHTHNVTDAIYSPDGSKIISSGLDKLIRIWDARTGACTNVLEGHTSGVSKVVYSPREDQIATTSQDHTVRVWDVKTGQLVHTLGGHRMEITSIQYSPDGSQIVTSSKDYTARLWDAEIGRCIHTFYGHTSYVYSALFSPKGDRVVTGGADKTIRLWDVKDIGDIQSIGNADDKITNIAYSPKRGLVVSGGFGREIKIWDVETSSNLYSIQGHSRPISGLTFSPAEDQIASCSDDGTIRIWNVETGESIHTLACNHDQTILGVAYSPTGEHIASGSSDKTIRVWDVKTGATVHTLKGHSGMIHLVAYSPNGVHVGSACYDNVIRVWDARTGNCIQIMEGHSGHIKSMSFSPCGTQIASASFDGTVRLWDIGTGSTNFVLQHSERVNCINYSADGSQIVSGGDDNTVRLWDVTSGNSNDILYGHTAPVLDIKHSPNGDHFASTSSDWTLRIWSVETKQCISVISGFRGNVKSFIWESTLSSLNLLTGCADASLRRWKIDGGTNKEIALLCWSTTHNELIVNDMALSRVHGLGPLDLSLIKQKSTARIL